MTVRSGRDEHVRGENRPRPERRCTQAFEDPAFAVDGNDGDEREHGVDRDEDRDDDRHVHPEKGAEPLTARRRH